SCARVSWLSWVAVFIAYVAEADSPEVSRNQGVNDILSRAGDGKSNYPVIDRDPPQRACELERFQFFSCAGSAHAPKVMRNTRRCCDEGVFAGSAEACAG